MKFIKIKIDNIYFDCDIDYVGDINNELYLRPTNKDQLELLIKWLNESIDSNGRIKLKKDIVKDISIIDEEWNERIIYSSFIKSYAHPDLDYNEYGEQIIFTIFYDYFDRVIIKNCQLEMIQNKIDKIKSTDNIIEFI